jgi:hypothetical protein
MQYCAYDLENGQNHLVSYVGTALQLFLQNPQNPKTATMKKQSLFIILTIFSLLLLWKMYLPISSIPGKYVNNNTRPILEGPSPIAQGQDTLILFEEGTFTSKTWGDGTYEVETSLRGTKIDLSYTFAAGQGGFHTTVSKSLLGNLKIWLDYDLEFYFEKID